MKKIHVIQSLMEKSESSRLLLIAFHWSQHIYGVSYSLLDTDRLFVDYGNSISINHFIKLLRKHKAIVNWFANEKRCHIIIRNIDSYDTVQSVSADAYPIKFLSGESFYIMRSPGYTLTNNKPKSLIEYIHSKPDW